MAEGLKGEARKYVVDGEECVVSRSGVNKGVRGLRVGGSG